MLISKIIKYLKECAEDYVKNKFRKTTKKENKVQLYEVVLGIPATFSDGAKNVLRSAANLAGFVEVFNCILAWSSYLSLTLPGSLYGGVHCRRYGLRYFSILR